MSVCNFKIADNGIKGIGNGETGSSFISFDEVEINSRESLNLFEYYSNLTTNLGDNPSVNCVSVACGMIVSFYDTYYNDSLIPEEYDVAVEA